MTVVAVRRPRPDYLQDWFPGGLEPVRSADVLAYASGAKIRPAYGRSETAGYLPWVAETFGLRVVCSGAWALKAEVTP